MKGNIPTIHPLPGTTVQPRRVIVLDANHTDQDLTDALRELLVAAETGEPAPVVICPWDDGAPRATFGQSTNTQEG